MVLLIPKPFTFNSRFAFRKTNHSDVKTIDETIWSYNLILKLKSLSTVEAFTIFFTLLGEMLSRKFNLGLLLFT